MTKLTLTRINRDDANEYVRRHHRHRGRVPGAVFALSASLDGVIVGVVIVGRPVSRHRDDGVTAEVTRLCTDGTPNVCSFLYGAARRAAFALGFTRIGTYILASEPGTSLHAAGWRQLGEVTARSWNAPSRPRIDRHPLQAKLYFEASP
jgi:hypothetical protein